MLVVRKKKGNVKRRVKKRSVYKRKALGASLGQKVVKELHPFTLAHVNPFDRNCFEARVPDQSTAPSSAFFLYDTTELTTTLTNATACVCAPWTTKYLVGADNTIGATSWNWFAAFGSTTSYSKLATMQAQYELIRPVAHGVRLSCPLSPQTVTGYTHVCLYPMSNYNDATFQFPTSVSQMQDCPFYQRFTLAQLIANPITLVNKFSDQCAFDYRDPNDSGTATTTGTDYHNFGWMVIVIATTGHPSGSIPLNVENICHMEGQATRGQLSGDLTSERYRPTVMAGTSEYAATASPVQPGSNNTSSSIMSRVFNKLNQCAIEDAVPFLIRGLGNVYSSSRTQPGSNARRVITDGIYIYFILKMYLILK